MSSAEILEFSARMDGLIENAITGLGQEGIDKTQSFHVGYGRRLSRWSLEQLYESSWICGNAVDAYPVEATRKWLEIKLGEGANQGLIRKFDDYQERLAVKSAVRTASKWARLYGGAVILPIIEDGLPFNEPINPDRIRSIRRLEVLDSEDIRPYLLNDDPQDPTFYEMVVPPYIADKLEKELGPDIRTRAGVLVHKSRVIRFDGVEMPRRILEKNRGWGISIIQRMFDTFTAFDMTDKAIANLVDEASLFTYAIQGLSEMLAKADAKSEKALRARLRALRQGKTSMKAIIHDAEREKPGVISRQFTGLPDIMDRWMARIAGATRLPMTVLFMRGPVGLAAQGTGDTEEKMWAKLVSQFQEEEYSPRLKAPATQLGLFDLIWLAKDGPTSGKMPDDWGFEFKPLIEETLEERLNSRDKQSNIDRTYKDMGVLLPEEIRESRFGGSEYSFETVLDEKAWKKKQEEEAAMSGFGENFGGDFGGQFDPAGPPPDGGQPPEGGAPRADSDDLPGKPRSAPAKGGGEHYDARQRRSAGRSPQERGLKRKEITNKEGERQAVWIRPGEPKREERRRSPEPEFETEIWEKMSPFKGHHVAASTLVWGEAETTAQQQIVSSLIREIDQVHGLPTIDSPIYGDLENQLRSEQFPRLIKTSVLVSRNSAPGLAGGSALSGDYEADSEDRSRKEMGYGSAINLYSSRTGIFVHEFGHHMDRVSSVVNYAESTHPPGSDIRPGYTFASFNTFYAGTYHRMFSGKVDNRGRPLLDSRLDRNIKNGYDVAQYFLSRQFSVEGDEIDQRIGRAMRRQQRVVELHDSLMNAITRTPEVNRLIDAVDAGEMVAPSGRKVKVDDRYVAYLLNPTELYARAYDQWMSTRIDPATRQARNVGMASSFLKRSVERELFGGYPSQWSKESFVAIANEFESVYDEIGLLKGQPIYTRRK